MLTTNAVIMPTGAPSHQPMHPYAGSEKARILDIYRVLMSQDGP